MRVRMLTRSDTTTIVNRDTVPVRIDITDSGIPQGIPALRWHYRALASSPWIHRRFGHFALIEPNGHELLAVAFGSQGREHLEREITRFYETSGDRDWHNSGPPPAIHNPEEVMPKHLKTGPLNWEYMTEYELAFDHWMEVIEIMAHEPERLAPGVLNAGIHTYADFLSMPHPDYGLDACRDLSVYLRGEAQQPPRTIPEDRRRLFHRAAIALVMIAHLPYDVDDPDLVPKVKAWWAEHRDDEQYRIEWSDDPKLAVAFYR